MNSVNIPDSPRTVECPDCEGKPVYQATTRRPFHWGPQPIVVIYSPVGCFFCGGTGRVKP